MPGAHATIDTTMQTTAGPPTRAVNGWTGIRPAPLSHANKRAQHITSAFNIISKAKNESQNVQCFQGVRQHFI
jgi:hypothetical protein